jgi:hypothetical protein
VLMRTSLAAEYGTNKTINSMVEIEPCRSLLSYTPPTHTVLSAVERRSIHRITDNVCILGAFQLEALYSSLSIQILAKCPYDISRYLRIRQTLAMMSRHASTISIVMPH